jgi:hypothetical protein
LDNKKWGFENNSHLQMLSFTPVFVKGARNKQKDKTMPQRYPPLKGRQKIRLRKIASLTKSLGDKT